MTMAIHDWVLTKLDEKKAQDVRLYATPSGDITVIATGSCARHVCALGEFLIREGRREKIMKTCHAEGFEQGHWVLLDVGGVMVHLFCPSVRAYYDLEGLWDERLALS